jgi:uncharacterized protein with PIN domain
MVPGGVGSSPDLLVLTRHGELATLGSSRRIIPKGEGMSWEYFRYRWDRMQSVDIGDNKVEIKRTQEDVQSLERMLVYIIGRMVMGQEVSLADPVIKEFFHVNEDEENPDKTVLEILGKIRHGADPRLTKCPKCGAAVRDLADVHDEVCMWCGHQLHTEY